MKKGILAVMVAACVWCGAVMAAGSIARAQFTSGVSDREPIDNLEAIPAGVERVFFYTEMRDLAGQTVTHRWERDGAVIAEVPFQVNAARWRVWSSKELLPGTKELTVVVVDGTGTELARQRVTAAAQ